MNWKILDVSQQQTYSRPAAQTFCNFGKYVTQQGFVVLRPGERLELLGIQIPEEMLHSNGKRRYRISLRYSPPILTLSEDILQEKPHYHDLTSNEMTVDFTAY